MIGVDLIALATFEWVAFVYAFVALALLGAEALLNWLDSNEPLTLEDV